MGIWMTRGPRHPTGLTPASRYIRIVSCDTRWRSRPKRSWISRIRGCRSVMARICLNCLMVSGKVKRRTMNVNTMIATPMLLKQMVYSTTSRFNMGRMIISRQRSSIPKGPYLATLDGLNFRPQIRRFVFLPDRISGSPRRGSSTRAPSERPRRTARAPLLAGRFRRRTRRIPSRRQRTAGP